MKQLKRTTIMQPEHLPWLGFVDKLIQSDEMILLDNVQFKKEHFENRNRIYSRSKRGPDWITVPVKKSGYFGSSICETPVDYSRPWQRKYLFTIRDSYSKSSFFKHYFPEIEDAVLSGCEHLGALNILLIRLLVKWLGLETRLVLASSLPIDSDLTGSDRIAKILECCESRIYFSGSQGNLEKEKIERLGVKIVFQQFSHPVYQQGYGDFISHLSFIDLLFIHGKEHFLEIMHKSNPRDKYEF